MKLAGLYEDEAKQPDKAIDLLPGDPQARLRVTSRRSRRSTASTRASGAGRRLAETNRAGDRTLAGADPPSLISSSGAAPSSEQHLGDEAAAVGSYREALALDGGHAAGARTALQAYLSSENAALQMAAVEVLEPIYERTDDLGSSASSRPKQPRLRPPGRRAAKRVSAAAAHRPARGQARQRRAGLGRRYAKYSLRREAPTPHPRARRSRTSRRSWTAWQPPRRSLRSALAASAAPAEVAGPARGASSCWSSPSPTTRSWVSPRRPSSTSGARRRSSPRTLRRSSRFERASTRARGGGTAPRRHAHEEGHARRGRRRTRADPHAHRHGVGGDDRQRRPGHRDLERRAGGQRPGTRRLLEGPRRPVPARRGDYRDLRRQPAAAGSRSRLDADETIRAARTPGRAARAASARWAAPSRPTGGPAARARARRDACGYLERILPDPKARGEHGFEIAQLFEPIYKIRGDWPKLIGVYEISTWSPPRRRSGIEDHAPGGLIADGHEVRLDDPRARLRGPRAGSSGKRPAQRRGAGHGRAAWPTPSGSSPTSCRASGTSWARSRTPSSKNALYHKIALLCELESLGDDVQAAAAYAAALEVSPRDLRAANALEQLYLRGNDCTPNLVKAALAQGRDRRRPRREEGPGYYRAVQIYEEVLEDLPDQVEASPFIARRSPSTTPTASRSISSSASTSASRAGVTSRTFTRRRPSSPRTRPRRSRCCSCWGRSTIASSAIPSGPSRRTSSIADLDPDDYDAAQVFDRLYQQTQRWYDLLAVLERQTELSAHARRGRTAFQSSAWASCGASTSRT